MSLAELESQILELPPTDQNRIAAMLTTIRMKREGLFEGGSKELDKPRSEWVNLRDVEDELYEETPKEKSK